MSSNEDMIEDLDSDVFVRLRTDLLVIGDSILTDRHHIDARRKPTTSVVRGIRQSSIQTTSDGRPTPHASCGMYKIPTHT
jgi:hypothetical protein